jgi:hypothetical protein
VLSVCRSTSRLLSPHAIVARLRFSDLQCTHAANILRFDEKRPRQTTPLKPAPEGSPP